MRDDLIKIRAVFEEIDKSNLPVTFENFPLGACGDTCEVLAEILREKGHGSFQYKAGILPDGRSHAWLESNSTIVDITADQFDEISDSVYMGPSNYWYQLFEIDQQYEAGYTKSNPSEIGCLSEVHSRVNEILNA